MDQVFREHYDRNFERKSLPILYKNKVKNKELI